MGKTDGFLVVTSDDTTIGLFNRITFGVADYSKLEEVLVSKEGVWYIEGFIVDWWNI